MNITPEIQAKLDEIKKTVELETVKWLTEQEVNIVPDTIAFLNGLKKQAICNILGIDTSWSNWRLNEKSALMLGLQNRIAHKEILAEFTKKLDAIKLTPHQEESLIKTYQDNLYREIDNLLYRKYQDDAKNVVEKLLSETKP